MSKILEAARPIGPEVLTLIHYLSKVLLVGPSGSGKSTLAMTMPGKKLEIDLDGRSESLVGFPDVEVIKILRDPRGGSNQWLLVDRLIGELQDAARNRNETFPYDSICFDGLTSANRISMDWALTLDQKYGLGGAPAQQHYMPQMNEIGKILSRLLALPCHVVVTAHPELIEDETSGRTVILPKATGKQRTELPNWFNETYWLFRKRESVGDQMKTRYYALTSGDDRYDFFKSSMNALGKYWNDPVLIDFDEERVGFAKLFWLRFGREASEFTRRQVGKEEEG